MEVQESSMWSSTNLNGKGDQWAVGLEEDGGVAARLDQDLSSYIMWEIFYLI